VKRMVLLAVAALLLVSAPAGAQLNAVGPRLGISSKPDQFVMGGQLEFGPFSKSFTITPNLELGFGDDVTTVQMNADGNYHFDIQETWNPYVGMGLGLAFYDGDGGSQTEFGANIIGGLRFKLRDASAIFTELRIGIADLPDLKVVAGWNFPL